MISSLTLQCVPAFLLRAQEMPLPLGDVLDGFDEFADSNDHFEFYWFPHTDIALTKRNNRVGPGVGPSPVGRVRGWVDDELLSNKVFELTNRLAVRRPSLVPRINRIASRALSAREYVDASYKVFCSERNVVFRESEYAVPRENVVDVIRRLRDWIDTSGSRIPFPIEVRVAAPDDIWLSTAYGRDTAYIAIHQYHRLPHDPYFQAFERIVSDYNARPHWGKLHTLTAEDLRDRLPPLRRLPRRPQPPGPPPHLREPVHPASLRLNPSLRLPSSAGSPSGRDVPEVVRAGASLRT